MKRYVCIFLLILLLLLLLLLSKMLIIEIQVQIFNENPNIFYFPQVFFSIIFIYNSALKWRIEQVVRLLLSYYSRVRPSQPVSWQLNSLFSLGSHPISMMYVTSHRPCPRLLLAFQIEIIIYYRIRVNYILIPSR